jgi:hypothetical protein
MLRHKSLELEADNTGRDAPNSKLTGVMENFNGGDGIALLVLLKQDEASSKNSCRPKAVRREPEKTGLIVAF